MSSKKSSKKSQPTPETEDAREEMMRAFIALFSEPLTQPGIGDHMEIAFTSLQGQEIDLNQYRGKVVLVDFWASWCGPCLAELPTLLKAYEDYHAKGFEVIAISLDEDRAALEAVIKGHNLPWPQDFSGAGWASPIVKYNCIEEIPSTFLIGKDGKVVATNLRGPELEKAVEKALAAGKRTVNRRQSKRGAGSPGAEP
jgi:thiol-disulfide isomerase/thioredoxin